MKKPSLIYTDINPYLHVYLLQPDRQTIMWSATWPSEVNHLAKDFMTNFTKITMGSEQLRANLKIEQKIICCQPYEKEKKY